MDIKRCKKEIEAFARKQNLRLVILYGSKASGNTHTQSDTDIAVLAAEKLTFDRRFEIQEGLSLAMDVSYDNIDLVDIRSIPPLLLFQIARDGELLYGTESEYELFYRRAQKRYIDAKPLFKATEEYVKSYASR